MLDQDLANNGNFSTSEMDPASKLKELEQEIDLIKTSIKRLLLDLRERMGTFQTPSLPYTPVGESAHSARDASREAEQAALEAQEAALEARRSQLDAAEKEMERDKNTSPPAKEPVDHIGPPVSAGDFRSGEQASAATAVPCMGVPGILPQISQPKPEKPNLQKVHQLFSWTDKAVKKFGQDRLEILLESYRIIGYVPVESREMILGIMHLMPPDLGTADRISAGEYISELYLLRRILFPDDPSLDSDMISVLMEQRRKEGKMPALPDLENRAEEARPVSDKNILLTMGPYPE